MRPLQRLSADTLQKLRRSTIAHYQQNAERFWEGTKDHDVSQNVNALLRHLGRGSHDILDLGCGPGRDLITFSELGHRPVGLDAAAAFVAMARAHSACEVWHQDMLALQLPPDRFDGIYANAVLFHVPSQELPRVLSELHRALRPQGVLFTSNPRGPDTEELRGQRYGCFLTPETWRGYVEESGFELLEEYFRPTGKPRAEQPWLATVWRRE